jgi:hypothetical protein
VVRRKKKSKIKFLGPRFPIATVANYKNKLSAEQKVYRRENIIVIPDIPKRPVGWVRSDCMQHTADIGLAVTQDAGIAPFLG